EQVNCITLHCKAAIDYIPARDAVEKAVDIAMSKHKLSTFEKPKRAFYCPCGKGRHLAEVSWLKPQRRNVFRCTIDYEPQKMPDCLNWLDQTSKRKRQHDELQHLPDVLESNIAYQVLVESTEEIKEYFSDDFSEIASKLLQMNLINERERSAITDTNTGWNKYQRMEELMERVKVAVKIKESVFFFFLDIFNEKGTQPATDFAQKLKRRYKDKLSDANLESS
uniref:CARD domain-containing protein n=1 Tax=Amphimedon queenslandica TaxID=400682 RepID=A0A1X7SNU1_AMPQE